MLIQVHPQNPQKRVLEKIAADIQKGEIYVLPTDTVYAFVTTLNEKRSIEKLYQLKQIPQNKPISLYCKDFSMASEYIRMNGNSAFRWMKEHLPGPYTLIFQASKKLPHYTLTKQNSVGIRIIDHPVISALLEILDAPLIGSSVFHEEEYLTYAEDLEAQYGKQVKGIVDVGPAEASLSTILDMREYPPVVLREGRGEIDGF